MEVSGRFHSQAILPLQKDSNTLQIFKHVPKSEETDDDNSEFTLPHTDNTSAFSTTMCNISSKICFFFYVYSGHKTNVKEPGLLIQYSD
jgi:hypothetical protein